ncbi:MAG: PAS domain S-box protein [Melioribacteraceae bacterium]|jgi:PAS domain S-box-containing protein|nr:PAS domain S-box protein [Melioribacteraceae bacterium]
MNSISKIPKDLENDLLSKFLKGKIIFSASSLEIYFLDNIFLEMLDYDFQHEKSVFITEIVSKGSHQKIVNFIKSKMETLVIEEFSFFKKDQTRIKKIILLRKKTVGKTVLISLSINEEARSKDDISECCFQLLLENFHEAIIITDVSNLINELNNLGIKSENELSLKSKEVIKNIYNILSKIKILFVNRAFLKLFHTEKYEDVDLIINNLFDVENFNSFKIFIASLITNKQKFNFTITARTITKKKITTKVYITTILNHDQEYGKVIISFTDITENLKIEETIKRLESRFRAVFESSDIGIAILNNKKRFIEVNEALLQLCQYNIDEIKNLDLEEIVLSPGSKTLNYRIDEIFEQKRVYLKKAVKVRNKKGEILWWKFTISLIRSAEEDPKYCIALVEDITNQKRIENEREIHLRKIKKTEKRLRLLSKYLLNVQERERSYISKEIHDEIGQVLTAIKIELQSALRFIKSKRIVNHLKEGISLVDYTINRSRDMSMNLRPSIIDDLGLIPAIRWFLDKEGQRNNLNIKFNSEFHSISISSELKITCYRIIQEGVTNIIRHANTKNVWIDILEKKEEILIVIIDDGVGFDIENVVKNAHEGKSMGILGMIERAELMGGYLTINNFKEGKGTLIKAHLRK